MTGDEADTLRMILGLIGAELQLEPHETQRLEAMIRARYGGERVYIARDKATLRAIAPELLPAVSARQARRLKKKNRKRTFFA